MAEGHRHHLFHHKKENERPVEAAVYADTAYGNGPDSAYAETTEVTTVTEPEVDFEELRAGATRASAKNEKPEAKKDPEDAHRHKIEEEVAAAAAAVAEPEVDNKKEKHCKYLKFVGEVGATAANSYASFSIKFRLQYEKLES